MNYVKLKDVCTINMGQSPSSDSYNENGHGVPFFQGNADFGERYPVTRKWCSAPTKMAAPEDILISVRAPIGAMNYAKEECCIGRGLAALTPNREKVAPEYIFWLLKGKNEELNRKGTGSTFKAIGRNILEETLVPNISLEKQTECAIILEKTYRVILSRKQQLQKLDELVKARFIEIFGNPLKNDKDFPTILGETLFKLSNGKALPNNKRFTVGIPAYGGNGISWYTDEILCDYDTVIIGRVGFQSGNVHLAKAPLWVTDNAMYISWINNKEYDIRFLCSLMEHIDFKRYQDAGDLKKIAQKPFMQMYYLMPPISLQKQYIAFVEQTNKSKVAVQKALDEAQLLFDSLMQKYFG